MKLICDGLDLSDAVMKVIKATPQKTTTPILEGIRLKAEDNFLILTATDLELAIIKKIRADVKIEGEVVVPGRLFADYVKKLTNEKIELSLTENKQLKVQYTDSEGFIQCLNIEEFPDLKKIEDADFFNIKKSDLNTIINQTIFSVAQDDSRPILKGCLFEVENSEIIAVALDGYRMALVRKPVKSVKNFKVIVPARSLSEISKIIEDGEEEINIYVQKNYFMVDYDNTKIITRLLDGDFINYKQIIPYNFSTTVTVNRHQLEDAIDRASILARSDRNNMIRFDIKDKILTLTSNSEIANITENITISLLGKDLTIAFNAKFMQDCLHTQTDEFIKLHFTTSAAPCVIKPNEGNNYLYLVLPVKIQA
ncbi:MAG: DNA polymerase III subunit beta [Clostridia bacterium]|jgi:DNA polymerase-3 subunit beta|nr:DNA polymerase III subunit beta [Clostridia bacterium]MDD4275379.1 DNA polymerase III subunit beta [Clostridia bacterium]